eukprot:GAHX01001587.1.p1 GENE.GAHX01001587.1~~GAHX01001587.1.p1  ORF type:complete len:504 (-),score=149.56 GAHX01001587.1:1683-3194(-)
METQQLSPSSNKDTITDPTRNVEISESENEEIAFCKAFLKSEARRKEIKQFQVKIKDNSIKKLENFGAPDKKLNSQMLDALNLSIAALAPIKPQIQRNSPGRPVLKMKKFKELIVDIHKNTIKEVAGSNIIKNTSTTKTTRKDLMKELREQADVKASDISNRRIERYKKRGANNPDKNNESENEIELISEEEFMHSEITGKALHSDSAATESNPIPDLNGDSSEASLFSSNKKDGGNHISEGSDHIEYEAEKDVEVEAGMKVEDFLDLEAEESGSNVEKDDTTSLSEGEIKKLEEFVDVKKTEYNTDEDEFKEELEVAEEEKKAGYEYNLLHQALVERDKRAMDMLYGGNRNQNFDDNEESEFIEEYDKDGNLVKVPKWKSKLNKRRTLKMANYRGEEDVEFKQRKEEVLENALDELDRDLSLSNEDEEDLIHNNTQQTAEDYIKMFKNKFNINEIAEEKKREDTNTKGGIRSVVSYLKKPKKDNSGTKLQNNVKKIQNIIER